MADNVSNLDVCALLGPDELLREVPDGVRTASGNCTGPSDENHYTWTIDSDGNVGSVCVNVGSEVCEDPGGDGYQGVWP
jgi:hypothetical protein